MKKTVINACRLMTALMVAGAGGYVHATDSLEVTFNLSAKYSTVTCDTTLGTSGDITGTDIDFGTFSSDQVAKTKNVVLTLDCSQGSDLPDTVKVGFSAQSPAHTDTSPGNRLYPALTGQQKEQNVLYYDWFWGDNINDTLQQTASPGHTGIKAQDPVDLDSGQGVYEVNKGQNTGNRILQFPLKITRGVTDTDQLDAGDYTAAVTVTITYD